MEKHIKIIIISIFIIISLSLWLNRNELLFYYYAKAFDRSSAPEDGEAIVKMVCLFAGQCSYKP